MLTIAGGILIAVAALAGVVVLLLLLVAAINAAEQAGEPWWTVWLGVMCLAAAIWFAGPVIF